MYSCHLSQELKTLLLCSGFKYWFLYIILDNRSAFSKHLSWWKSLEGVLKKSIVLVFRSFQTSWSRQLYLHWSYVLKTSEYIPLGHNPQDVFKTPSRSLPRTSSRHLLDVLPKHLEDAFKTLLKCHAKMSSRHLQEVFETSSRCIIKLNCFC